MNYIKWGFESRLKQLKWQVGPILNYIKWGFESRLKLHTMDNLHQLDYIKWGFESRLKRKQSLFKKSRIISNGDLKVG